MSAFGGKADFVLEVPRCLLLTQSGHQGPLLYGWSSVSVAGDVVPLREVRSMSALPPKADIAPPRALGIGLA
jgi:hypothetical protein